MAITTAILDLIYSGEPVSAMQLHAITNRLTRALAALEGHAR